MSKTSYTVLWSEEARNDLHIISRSIALKLAEKINNYLAQAPQELGKALVGKYNGLYRYRYGDYRVIYEIDKTNKILIVNRIGHRSNVYSL